MAVSGGGGSGGGGGTNGQWEAFVPAISPLPPNQASQGQPARVTTPCVEFITSRHRWLSWWGAYAQDWPGEDTDLRAEVASLLSIPDTWEVYEDEIMSFQPSVTNSRLKQTSIPEEVEFWRLDSPHWLSSSRYISSATVEFAVIEGNPRFRWEVFCDDYQCFTYLIPVPPVPPVVPVPGTPQVGHGHGTVFAGPLSAFMGSGFARKRRGV